MIKKLADLVNKFNANLENYKSEFYNETSCRMEFIDPLLEIFGWDISNKKGLSPNFREVIPEYHLKSTGRPDYALTYNGQKKCFLEVKKPFVDISENKNASFQARKYGWSAKHKIAVLTNFEYLIIYDATVMPDSEDSYNVAVLKKYHYSEYLDKFDDINAILSRDSIYAGTFDDYWSELIQNTAGIKIPVDEKFLEEINEWRLEIAECLKTENLDMCRLNQQIQKFINKIVFLRMCEDRNLPILQTLENINDSADVKETLIELFLNSDIKYDSGIFDDVDDDLTAFLDNNVISSIISTLYYPNSPYAFGVIEPEVLGQIYELFLEKQVNIENGNVVLEYKNRLLHKDIVSTPADIARYMVKNSLELLCNNKTPDEILDLKISDISCGSGLFLIEVYDYLLNYFTSWYIENDPSFLVNRGNNVLELPYEFKKEILERCIYGIDIDSHAVEITKFNLLLKLLENESELTLPKGNSLLPKLNNNIISGNSLIDFRKTSAIGLSQMDAADLNSISNSYGNFDLIIGNPPYLKKEDLINTSSELEMDIYDNYNSAEKQYDKYFLFLERALELAKQGGYICYLVPPKFANIVSGKKLRGLLSKYVLEFINFGALQLFKSKNKIIYSSIITLKKEIQNNVNYEKVKDFENWIKNGKSTTKIENTLSKDPWDLFADISEIIDLNRCIPLESISEILNGIQTSAESRKTYWFPNNKNVLLNETDSVFEIERDGKTYNIEKAIVRPYFKPERREMGMTTYDPYVPNKWIIFPYDENGNLYSISEMKIDYLGAWNYLKDQYWFLVPRQINSRGTRDVPHATPQTWYHYGRSQGLTIFNNVDKIIVGVLRNTNLLYLYDKTNSLIASGGTAGYCAIFKKEDSSYDLEYIQAILNSDITEKLVKSLGSEFEGGFVSRGTAVLKRIPIIKIDFENENEKTIYDKIVKKSQEIREINERIINRNYQNLESLDRAKTELINNINEEVIKLYTGDY
ncbi:Eco57I restriction-modification methylase domain-containing protein [Methanococcus sp. CF]